MRKKITALLTALTLLLPMLCAMPAVASTEGAVFAIDMAEVTTIRSELKVAVTLGGNPGVTGAVLELGFDPAVFTLTDVEKGALCAANDSTLLVWDPSKTDIALASSDAVTGDGVLVRLTFRVADTVTAGNYTITVTGKELEDDDLEDFTATAASKTVEVRDYLWGDANGDKRTDLADAQAILKWKVFLLQDSDLNMTAADVDRNGSVGLTDVLTLLQWLAGYVEWDANGDTTPPADV